MQDDDVDNKSIMSEPESLKDKKSQLFSLNHLCKIVCDMSKFLFQVMTGVPSPPTFVLHWSDTFWCVFLPYAIPDIKYLHLTFGSSSALSPTILCRTSDILAD